MSSLEVQGIATRFLKDFECLSFDVRMVFVMDYVDSLRIFCAVVQQGSFTKAADSAGLSKPIVSRAIMSLEKRLNVRLFNRTTRHLSTTEAADLLFAGCTKVLDELDALEDGVANHSRRPMGILRLVAHASATGESLALLTGDFKRRYSTVHLNVTLVDRPINLATEGYDIALLPPFMLTSDRVISRPITPIPLVLVAAPKYLMTHALPRTPEDLSTHQSIAFSPLPDTELVFEDNGIRKPVPLKFEIASNSAEYNLQMTLQGFGVGVLPVSLAKGYIANGELVRVLTTFPIVDTAAELRLAYSSRKHLPAKVRLFIEHTIEFFGADSLVPKSSVSH